MIEIERCEEALRRVSMTDDGYLIFCLFKHATESVLPDLNASDGALRLNDGKRRYAHYLCELMKAGVDEHGARRRPTDEPTSGQPVIVAGRKPVAVTRSFGAARRVTSGGGWDQPADDKPAT